MVPGAHFGDRPPEGKAWGLESISCARDEEESAVVGPRALMKHASVHPRRASYRDTKLSLAN